MRLPPDLSCIVPPQAVFDFSNSAIALRRHFGEGLTIRQTLDLQLAFEALHGSFRADILSVLNALEKHETHADAAVKVPVVCHDEADIVQCGRPLVVVCIIHT